VVVKAELFQWTLTFKAFAADNREEFIRTMLGLGHLIQHYDNFTE